MYRNYIDSLYYDWLKGASVDELAEVIAFIVDIMEKKKGCRVIGTLDIRRGKDDGV